MGSGSGGKKVMRFDSIYNVGYRFNPSDRVLVEDYLRKKNNGESLPLNIIGEINLYACSPQVLVDEYHHLHGTETQEYSSSARQKECYFFTRRDKKYRNGKRPRRHTNDEIGYWKATGADQRIFDDNNKDTGYVKKTLVYYLHDKAKGTKSHQKTKVADQKTEWIMHEYCLKSSSSSVPNDNSLEGSSTVEGDNNMKNNMRLEGWALCRIYEKRRKGKEQNTGEDEDENSDDVVTDDEEQEDGDVIASSQQQCEEANVATTSNSDDCYGWENARANASQGCQVVATGAGFGHLICNEELPNIPPPTVFCPQIMVDENRSGYLTLDQSLSIASFEATPQLTNCGFQDRGYTGLDEELYSLMNTETAPPSTDSLFDLQPLETNIKPPSQLLKTQDGNMPLPQVVSNEMSNQTLTIQEMNQVPNEARYSPTDDTEENGYLSWFYQN